MRLIGYCLATLALALFSNPSYADQFDDQKSSMEKAIIQQDKDKIDLLSRDPYTLFTANKQSGGCDSYLAYAMRNNKPAAFAELIALGVDLNASDPACVQPRILDLALQHFASFEWAIDQLLAKKINLNLDNTPGGSLYFMSASYMDNTDIAAWNRVRSKLIAAGDNEKMIGQTILSPNGPLKIGIAEDISRYDAWGGASPANRPRFDAWLHGRETLISKVNASVLDSQGHRAIDFTCDPTDGDPLRAQGLAQLQNLLKSLGSPAPVCTPR